MQIFTYDELIAFVAKRLAAGLAVDQATQNMFRDRKMHNGKARFAWLDGPPLKGYVGAEKLDAEFGGDWFALSSIGSLELLEAAQTGE